MAVDASLAPFVAALTAAFPEAPELLPVPDYRRRMAELAGPAAPLPPELRVEDHDAGHDAGGLTLRSYRPAGAEGVLPALLYFHGGGWVMGSIASHEPITAALALQAGIAVFSVEYRLAPEHPFPAGFSDGINALRWLTEQAAALRIDPGRLAIGGDSAGANLAAAIAQQCRDIPLAAQMLAYPALDDYFDTPSYHQNAEGPFLTRALAQAFWGHYTAGQGAQGRPEIAPLRNEALQGLPPAILLVAEHDPLRDEGAAYAAKLRNAGVAVDFRHAEGMIHGFLRAASISPAAASHFTWLVQRLKARLGSG